MQFEPLEVRRLLAADTAESFAFAAAQANAVVVIDSALVGSIPQEELAGAIVVSIDDSRDAIGQITTALAGLADVDTLRVISHGSDGSLWFGGQRIDAAALSARAIDVSAWGRSLSADADILLYGCSVASTLDGRLFVEQLGSLTQADIAASTDATGQSGDTDLEFQRGRVTAALLASAARYEQAGVSLDINTYNSSITNWTNNGNGTVTVTVKYDITGLFYYASGSSPDGYVYMYLNGREVASQAVTVDTTFSEYGSVGGIGIGSVTRGSKNLLFTATLTLPQLPYSKDSDRRWVGENKISVSPIRGVPTTWMDRDPLILRIEAPYYFIGGYGTLVKNYTVAAGQEFYAQTNVLGTGPITQSATGLPNGVTISSTGVILGRPVSGSAGVYPVVLRSTNGFAVTEYSMTITVTNQAPSFATTGPATVSGATEDTPFEITHAALAAALDDSDPNGDPLSFRIDSVLGGTLTKNGTPVTAGSTLIAPGESLVWTPPASVNGTRDAFTVTAYDGALSSATSKTVRVAIGAVNDAPTLTQFSGPVATGNEDTAIAISFADLMAKGDEDDIDSTVNAFVIKAVTTGSLRIGTSEATATPWNASTNKVVTSGRNAYWTPDANANGPQAAFTAVARDDGGLESATPVQAVVTVNAVNDVPTLSSVAIISGAAGSDPFEISYASLAAAANAADIDADAIAFRIEAVSTGSLEKWTGSAWASVVPGATLVSATDKLRWTPVAGSSGLRNAFTVKAWDGQLASATAIQVRVDGDRWRVLPWTDAASSGITPTHRYTHAYSFGAAGSFAVGGVTFTGVAGGNPAVTGRLSTTGFAGVATNDANNLADASRSLANDAIASSATTSTITLNGLLPGGRYVLSLFTVGLESGTRLATLSSAMGQITVNENEYGNNNGVRVDYNYLADASGSVTITLAAPGSSFNLYGLANREYGAAIRLDAPTSLTYDAAPKQFQAGLQGYATASNSPFVSAGTLHSVVLKADGTVSAFGTNDFGQTAVPAGLANVVAVSAGGYHTLALKSDGTVVAWGNNAGGQSIVPAGLSNVVSISAGGSHGLALKTDGTVVAWGSNTYGQCNVPAGLTGVVAISAGSTHSLALKADGTVVAWGYYWYDYATPPAGLTDVVAISAGYMHSLALKSDGTVVAWGNNGSFQSSVPTGLKGVVAISAGSGHSVALKSDGTIVAWGDRDNYGLTTMPAGLAGVVAIDAGSEHSVALKADGTVVTFGWTRFNQRYLPTALGPLAGIASGLDHTLALKTDGTVVAWGSNAYGQTNVPAGLSGVVAVQAGDQFSVALKSDRTVVSWGAPIGTVGTGVAMPAGLADVMQISASEDHALALKADGTVVAWGDNSFSQSSVPAGLSGVVSVAAGGMGSLALKADGTVVYWGSPYNGRGAVPAGLSGVRAIAAGEYFSLALKTDGTVVAWGDSTYASSWQVPAGLTGVVAIEAGFYHALALRSDGSVVAWGNVSEVPSTVNGVGVISLAAGWNNSIALKSDGTIVAWGNNNRGQNSPPAAAQFPAVGLAGRLLSIDAPSFSYSYQGRGSTVYAASATPPTTSGDYTVTVTSTGSGDPLTISRNFTIAKVTPSLSYFSRVNTIAYGSRLTSDQVGSTGAWGVVGNSYQVVPGSYVYSPAVGAVLPLGTQTLQVTFLPTDTVNFNPAVATGTITVTKATLSAATITLTPLGSLTYTGTAKAYTASATGVAGFTYSYSGRGSTAYGPSGTAPTYAGDYTVTATVNDPNYTGTKSLDFTITKAVPTITTNPTASTLTFGQTLAAATLSGGVTSVPGSFAFGYSGTAPSAGTWSYDVVFTPTDTINYTTATGTASVTVNQSAIAAGAFTFSTPSSLIYNGSRKIYSATAAGPWGTLYGMTYSYAGVGGTTYGPLATAPTNAGSYAVTATLTGTNFTGSATRTFTITQVTPTVTWAAPAPISYGTALSATQLNATASVAGNFTYTPAIGTVLAAGGRTLQAVFTPTDTVNYTSVTTSVPLQVNSSSMPISVVPPAPVYDGTPKPYVLSQMAYLSSGWAHSLTLRADGTVTAWGSNSNGQSSVPAGLSGVVQVSAGSYHSVAVKSNGALVTWGSDSWSQRSGAILNLPYTGPGWTAVTQGDSITNATAVAAGGALTVVLRADGTVTVLGSSTYTSAVDVPVGLSGVTAVAAGDGHAVALKSDGTVVAWGNNSSGQTNVPAGLSGVVAISAGGNHTLALKADGTVVAWGNNSLRQTTVPAGLSGVVAVTTAFSSSFALKADGSIIGWGAMSPVSAFMQIAAPGSGIVAFSCDANGSLIFLKTDGTFTEGNGTILASGIGFSAYSFSYAGRSGTTYAASSSAPTNAGDYTLTITSTDPNYSTSRSIDFTIAKATPTIATLPQAAIIAEGQPLSAAVLDGGETSVPGTFAFSTPTYVPSAGVSTQEITFTPTDTANYNAVTRTVTVLSQGTNAATPAILSLPTAGPITFGQRLEASTLSGGSASVPGTFVYSSRLTVANPGTARQSVTFIPTDIASYAAVTMFVPLTVYDGIISPLNIPVVPPPSLTYNGSPKAFSVSRSPLISGFYRHVLVVNADGTVTAFGDNDLGGCDVPAGLTGVVAVSAGDSISLALKSDGTVVEWGGQAPWGPMYGRPPAGLTNVVAISRTGHGLALKSDGTVVAWGDNNYGQRNVPAGLTNVVAIAGSEYTSFALKSDGTVVSWGRQSNIPAGLSGVIAIDACPYGGAVALKSDGTVVTWDFGSPPDGLSGVVAVAAGSTHMAALKSDGTVVAWGANTAFRPSGDTTNLVPYELTGVVAISAGSNRTFALKADGSVVWWGQGSTNWGLYRVNGELYRTPTGGYVDLRKGDPIAGVSAGFAYTTTYSGRNGTVYASSATPPTEPGDYSVTVVGTNSAFTTPKTYAFSIAKATPSITAVPAAAGITYGQSLASAILSGGSASVAGTFAFAAPATAPNAGTNSQSVVFTPTDTTRYLPVTLSVPVAVARATPTLVTLPTATTITYGQSLASAVLGSGLATVAGAFAFTSPGTTPATGTASHGITFTPADVTNYELFTTTVNLFVAPATPSITVPPTVTSIRYGQTLANSILSGGTGSVPGTFAFADTSLAPSSGTASQDVVFTPTDTATYAPVTLAVAVHVTSFASADDAGSAGEDSGTANATVGFDAFGNVLDNETNYDGSSLTVTGITGSLGAGAIGPPLAGLYGSLTILADGSYAYLADNTNAAVQALAPGATLIDTFTYAVASVTDTASATLRITIFGGNDAPTFSTLGSTPLTSGVEDTETAITFAAILAASNAADVDGTVTAFVVRSLASGTLRIGPSAAAAIPWDADSNAIIDATHIAYWTPDADAHGTLAAFSVVARDDGGLDSPTPVAIRIAVDAVNDAPVLTPVAIAYTDTPAADVFSAANGTLAATDIDNTTFTFGITGVTPVSDVFTQVGSYGTLTVNRLTGAYTFAPNDAAINAATGDVSETFPVFVSDGSAENATGAALLTITTAGLSERPTLTAFTAGTTLGTEDTTQEILFSDLLSRGDAADGDGTVTAFVVTGVQSGRLSIGTSAATATAWNAETNSFITASLNGYWTPDADANGPINAFAVVAMDDTGIASTPSVVLQVVVAAVNDGPSLRAFPLAAGTTAEDTEVELTFAAVAAAGDEADLDGTVTAFVVKAVSSGTLKIGASAATATAWDAATNAVIGAGLNAYWTPAANATGSLDAFTVVARDDGGLESSVSLAVLVAVSAVNDAPLNTVPAAQAVDEDSTLVFSSGNGNLISVADVDVASDAVEVSLAVSHGSLTLSGIAGLTFTTGDGTADATLAFSGTLADVNAALAGLAYAPDAHFTGSDSLSITSSDLGSKGSGGTKTDTDSVAITVNAVNDAPTDIGLAGTTVAENASSGTVVGTLSTTDVDAGETFTYSLVSGTGDTDNAAFAIVGSTLKTNASFNFEAKSSYSVRVRTTDAGGLFAEKAFTITVTDVNETPTDIALSAPTVAENAPSGTTVGTLSTMDADAGDTFTYTLVSGTGSADNGSFAIDGGTLKTAASFNYEAKNSYSVRVRTTDAGGIFTEKAFTIAVTDVAEPVAAPTVVVPPTFTVTEDTPTGLMFSGTPFADVDSPAGKEMTVTLTVIGDAITATTEGGVTVAGTAAARTFTGTLASLNAYFTAAPARITYTPAANSTASRTLTTTITESNGNGSLSSAATSTITITPINDAPIASAPASFTVTEDVKGNLVWPATSTPFADIDSQSLTVTLSIADGTISAASTAAVTVGGTATARTFTGTQTGLNAFFKTLGAIGYTTARDNTIARTLTTTVSDGSLSTPASSTINITPVADAPTVVVPATFTVMEDTPTGLTFTGTPFADVDSPAGKEMTVTLTVIGGAITATTGGGVTVAGTTAARTFAGTAAARTFTGTLASLNAYFTAAPARITYTPAANSTASRTLTTTITESNGNGSLSSAATSTITITPINDAPIASAPASFTVTEDVKGNLVWPATSTPFADIDSQSLTVTLSIADGTISAASTAAVTVGGTATARTFTGTQTGLNAFFKTLGAIGYTTARDNTIARTLTTTVSDGSLSTPASSTINITPVADAPTINPAAVLRGGKVGTPYEITYETLRSSLNVADAETASPSLVIQAVNSGTLQKWSGTAWVTVSTASTAALPQRSLSAGQKIRWLPPVGVSGDRAAFKVKASDGMLTSAVTAQVTIQLAP